KTDQLKVFFHSAVSGFHERAISEYSSSRDDSDTTGRREFEKSRLALGRVAVSRTKRSMLSSRLRESLSICSAAAESSVELDADCWTSSRIFSMARTTACAPEACSSTAELISCVISVRRLVALAICDEPTDCSLV